jgi:YfiH family protein
MSGLQLRTSAGIQYYAFDQLDALSFVVHAFSTRANGASPFPHGALNLSYLKNDDPKNVERNRARFLAALAWQPGTLRVVRQVHSSQIHILNKDAGKTKDFLSTGGLVGQGDGLITAEPHLLLGIQTADCFPILLVDPVRRVVANLHAGWRGTLARIADAGITRMNQEFNSAPVDLIAAIGPGIGPCCYEVGEEVVDAFGAAFSYANTLFVRRTPNDKARLDLLQANARQLLDTGLKEENILRTDLCTACHTDQFFSYRRDKEAAGRMLAVIGIRQ